MTDDFREGSTSITLIETFMIVTVADELTKESILAICDQVTTQAFQKASRGVVLDFSKVSLLDPLAYENFVGLSRSLQLLGVAVAWVGLRPSVICALVDLGVDLQTDQIIAAIGLEQGLEALRNRTATTGPAI